MRKRRNFQFTQAGPGKMVTPQLGKRLKTPKKRFSSASTFSTCLSRDEISANLQLRSTIEDQLRGRHVVQLSDQRESGRRRSPATSNARLASNHLGLQIAASQPDAKDAWVQPDRGGKGAFGGATHNAFWLFIRTYRAAKNSWPVQKLSRIQDKVEQSTAVLPNPLV